MKEIYLVFVLIVMLLGCQKDYYYLSKSDFSGVEIQSNNDVFKMNLKINAEATCLTNITVYANKLKYEFEFDSELDTLINRDWYGDPLTIKVEMDSCISGIPKIGIRLVD